MGYCVRGSDDDVTRSRGIRGPSISAIPFDQASDGKLTPLLSEPERNMLSRIAVMVRFSRRELIYRAGDPSRFVYNISSGVARADHALLDGTKAVLAFLFPDDWFGLAEEGFYINSMVALTDMTAYRLPVSALESLLRREPNLECKVLVKVFHKLREAQRHAIILHHHGALARLALFLQMLDRWREARNDGCGEIYLPMARSDIADYVGLSLAAVSRGFRTLASRHLITFRDRRHLLITEPAGLADLIAQRRRE